MAKRKEVQQIRDDAADRASAGPNEEPQSSHPTQKEPWVSKLPEPHGRHSINLGDDRLLRLSLSRRWKQNTIQFLATMEGVDPKPSKEDTEFLKTNGWTWRPAEKVWTRQLDKNTEDDRFARSGSDRKAEDQFVTLANAIRARNGLEPTAYSFGQETSR